MEPYRQTAGSSNPRIDIYDDPAHHDAFHIPPEPYSVPKIITTPSNDDQLSKSAYGAPGYEAPTAYTHVDPENRLLPFNHEDPKTKKRQPRYQVSHGIRVTWRIISLLLSITIIGLLGHTLYLQGKSALANFKYPSGMELPAWPEGLKLYPTYLFLGAAVVAFVVNFIALLLVCLPILHFCLYLANRYRLKINTSPLFDLLFLYPRLLSLVRFGLVLWFTLRVGIIRMIIRNMIFGLGLVRIKSLRLVLGIGGLGLRVLVLRW